MIRHPSPPCDTRERKIYFAPCDTMTAGLKSCFYVFKQNIQRILSISALSVLAVILSQVV